MMHVIKISDKVGNCNDAVLEISSKSKMKVCNLHINYHENWKENKHCLIRSLRVGDLTVCGLIIGVKKTRNKITITIFSLKTYEIGTLMLDDYDNSSILCIIKTYGN